jgi:hypothetical protein
MLPNIIISNIMIFINIVVSIFIVVIVILILLSDMLYSSGVLEFFDQKTVEFVPVNSQRYGLRSDKLRHSDIAKYYQSPYRNIVLDPTSGQMWSSNNSPIVEGIPGCIKIDCPPLYNDYDKLDTCWQCGTSTPDKLQIHDIHPHVKN